MKIILADDHPLFRQGIKQVVELIPNAKIVGEASDGLETYQICLSELPDLVILDLEMPKLNGIELCQKLKKDFPSIKIIILTMHKEKYYFDAANEAGVNGYMLKENAVEDLITCIKQVSAGQNYISPNINLTLSDSIISDELKALLQNLTPTERVILKLISEGKTSTEIAQFLFISANTVDNHRSNMTKKLNLAPEKNALLKFSIAVRSFLS
jgi:DNA-binding NarL/FixJ family response regulator